MRTLETCRHTIAAMKNFLVRVLSSAECICEDTSTDVDNLTLVKKVADFFSLFCRIFNYQLVVIIIMPSVMVSFVCEGIGMWVSIFCCFA